MLYFIFCIFLTRVVLKQCFCNFCNAHPETNKYQRGILNCVGSSTECCMQHVLLSAFLLLITHRFILKKTFFKPMNIIVWAPFMLWSSHCAHMCMEPTHSFVSNINQDGHFYLKIIFIFMFSPLTTVHICARTHMCTVAGP